MCCGHGRTGHIGSYAYEAAMNTYLFSSRKMLSRVDIGREYDVEVSPFNKNFLEIRDLIDVMKELNAFMRSHSSEMTK